MVKNYAIYYIMAIMIDAHRSVDRNILSMCQIDFETNLNIFD